MGVSFAGIGMGKMSAGTGGDVYEISYLCSTLVCLSFVGLARPGCDV